MFSLSLDFTALSALILAYPLICMLGSLPSYRCTSRAFPGLHTLCSWRWSALLFPCTVSSQATLLMLMSPPHYITLILCLLLSPLRIRSSLMSIPLLFLVFWLLSNDLPRSVIIQNSKTEEGRKGERETWGESGRKEAGKHILLKCLILRHLGSSVS